MIVIGGGFAGSLAARKFEGAFDVTLIDSKNYFEFTPGILRTIVEPEHLDKIQILHSDYFHGRIIVGHVKEVARESVSVNGEKIEFDYLVISSGSGYNMPFKEEDIVIAARGEHLKKYHLALQKAKKVLIVGGGLVGVELAGEIADHYNDKEITIVHGREKLIERNPIEASSYAESFLKRNGVKIFFNEIVKRKEGKHFISENGNKYSTDLAFLCTGITPNYEFLKKHFSKFIGKQGIEVNGHLQVNGFSNIFAAGDITAIKEEKTAQNAETQAEIVVHNIKALEKRIKLRKYESKKTPLVISLGKYNGIFIWKRFVLTGWIPALMKWGIEKKEIFRRKWICW